MDLNVESLIDVDGVKLNVMTALASIKEDEFEKWFQKWNERSDKCNSVNREHHKRV